MERELQNSESKGRKLNVFGYPGDASRVCGDGGIWEDPDVSNCSLRVFTMALVSVSFVCTYTMSFVHVDT